MAEKVWSSDKVKTFREKTNVIIDETASLKSIGTITTDDTFSVLFTGTNQTLKLFGGNGITTASNPTTKTVTVSVSSTIATLTVNNLTVDTGLKLDYGGYSANMFLTVDALGNATWANPPSAAYTLSGLNDTPTPISGYFPGAMLYMDANGGTGSEAWIVKSTFKYIDGTDTLYVPNIIVSGDLTVGGSGLNFIALSDVFGGAGAYAGLSNQVLFVNGTPDGIIGESGFVHQVIPNETTRFNTRLTVGDYVDFPFNSAYFTPDRAGLAVHLHGEDTDDQGYSGLDLLGLGNSNRAGLWISNTSALGDSSRYSTGIEVYNKPITAIGTYDGSQYRMGMQIVTESKITATVVPFTGTQIIGSRFKTSIYRPTSTGSALIGILNQTNLSGTGATVASVVNMYGDKNDLYLNSCAVTGDVYGDKIYLNIDDGGANTVDLVNLYGLHISTSVHATPVVTVTGEFAAINIEDTPRTGFDTIGAMYAIKSDSNQPSRFRGRIDFAETTQSTGATTVAGEPHALGNGTETAMYMKNDMFIIAYNHSGTMKYRFLQLTGTDALWTYSTSEP